MGMYRNTDKERAETLTGIERMKAFQESLGKLASCDSARCQSNIEKLPEFLDAIRGWCVGTISMHSDQVSLTVVHAVGVETTICHFREHDQLWTEAEQRAIEKLANEALHDDDDDKPDTYYRNLSRDQVESSAS